MMYLLNRTILIVLFFSFNFVCNPPYSWAEDNDLYSAINSDVTTPEDIFLSNQLGEPIKLEARIDVPLELNLKKALNLAIEQNLDIELAKNQKDIDKWKFWENIGHFFPDYKVGLSNQRFDGTFLVGGVFPVMSLTSNANAYMRFDYPFFQGGKGFFNTLAANKLFKSSKENLSASMKDILLLVTKTYNNLLKEQAQLDVQAKALEEAKAEYKLNQDLEKQGVGTKFDVLQTEVQLAEQEQSFIAQQASFREAAIELSKVLNLGQNTHIKPSLEDLTIRKHFNIDKPIDEIIKIAFENRPEIKKATLEQKAQKNYIAAAYSGFLPSANFYGQYGGVGRVFFHRTKVSEVIPDAIALDANGNPIVQMISRDRGFAEMPFLYQTNLNNITSVSNVINGAGKPFLVTTDDSLMTSKFIGIQLDWLIGDGLGIPTISKINQARNRAKIYSARLEKVNQQIEQEVRAAYLKVQTTEKLIDVAKKRLSAASEALRLAKVRLENGVGINTELLNAQKQYAGALAADIDAVIDYNNAQADLLHKLGLINVEKLTEKL